MDPERWHLVTEIFEAARGRESGEQEIFLLEACKSDELLRAEVESLLIASRNAEDFIETPVAESALALLSKSDGYFGVTARESLEGKSLLHYQIQEKLGEGGMGVVYRAIDWHLDRSVAIKVLATRRVSDPESRRRFLREAKAASALNHPNIITIHDTANVEDIDFIVMEYLAGQGLDRLLASGGLALPDVPRYGTQIADALAAAHAAGIVHRDLKPANVMIGANGLVKVLDFGVAKLMEEAQTPQGSGVTLSDESSTSLTMDGMLVGTDAYMSPEQVERGPTDARSDVFSLGALMYEMISGRRAFPGSSRTEVLEAILVGQPQPLREIVPGIPSGLEQIVSRCLAKHPDSRWQSMRDVKSALQELDDRRIHPDLSSGFGQRTGWAKTKPPFRFSQPLVSEIFLLRLTHGLAPDGEPKQLTFLDRHTITPAWMPDGKNLVFASGSHVHSARLWALSVAGSSKPRLLSFTGQSPVIEPAISRSTQRLLYKSFALDINLWRNQIARENERPVPPAKLTASNSVQEAVQYSPDGKQVLFLSYASGSGEIWVCDSDGSNTFQLLEGPRPGSPQWSPKGDKIIFSLASRGQLDLYSIPSQGGQTRQLTHTRFSELEPSFSHDGQWIYFASDRSRDSQIWKMPAVGGEAVQITQTGGTRPQESLDGKVLFYLKHRDINFGELWKVPVDGGAETLLIDGVLDANFDVKQGRIYYAARPDRKETQFLFYDFVSGKNKLIATIENPVHWGFSVSPDEEWILSSQGLRMGGSDLVLVENFR